MAHHVPWEKPRSRAQHTETPIYDLTAGRQQGPRGTFPPQGTLSDEGPCNCQLGKQLPGVAQPHKPTGKAL